MRQIFLFAFSFGPLINDVFWNVGKKQHLLLFYPKWPFAPLKSFGNDFYLSLLINQSGKLIIYKFNFSTTVFRFFCTGGKNKNSKGKNQSKIFHVVSFDVRKQLLIQINLDRKSVV